MQMLLQSLPAGRLHAFDEQAEPQAAANLTLTNGRQVLESIALLQ